MLPLAIAGGAMAAGGLIGALASGSLKKSRDPDKANYAYNYNPEYDWTQAQADYAQQQAAQGGLMGAADLARREALGQLGPSISEQQLRQGQARAAAEGYQMAASARGGAGAQMMALRQAQARTAEGQLAVNRDAGILRAQERQAAQARELQALAQAGGLASQMRQGSMGMTQAEVQAQMEAERYRQQGNMAYDQAMVNKSAADRQRSAQFWGGLMNAGASMGTAGMTGMMQGQQQQAQFQHENEMQEKWLASQKAA